MTWQKMTWRWLARQNLFWCGRWYDVTYFRIALGMSKRNKLCTQQCVVKVIVEGGVEMERSVDVLKSKRMALAWKQNVAWLGLTWLWVTWLVLDMAQHKTCRIFSMVPNTWYSLETTSVAFFGQGQTQISSGNTWRQRSMAWQKNSDKIYGQNSTR